MVLAVASGFSSARAQDNAVTLPPVVVSATTVPTPENQVASSVTVVTRQDIEREQRRTVPDILAAVPGLNIVQSGGPGGQTAIFIRGTGSQHVKVFIDGIDASDPSTPNGAPDLAHLLTSDIEQIEILRGPQSGLYGSNAIGGVISITTKRGEGPPKVRATIEGGSMGTFNQAAGLSGSQANIDYAFNVAHFRATDIQVTPAYMVPPGSHANPNAYDNWTYSTRLGAQLTDDFRVNLIGRYVDAQLLYSNDDPNTYPYVTYPARSTYGNQSAFGRAEAVWSALDGRFVNTFGANVTDYSRTNQDPNGSPQSRYDGTRTKYDWVGKLSVMPGQTLVMGLEREDDRASANVASSGSVFPYSAKTGNQAAFLEWQAQFAERFFLVANVRGDDNDQFGDHVTWRVAPAFILPWTETKLKASYGTGFKAPTLYELYGVGDYNYMGNPDLKPETSKGYDIGFEQPVAGDRFRFGATYFHNDITNLINSYFSYSPMVNTYVNVGQAVMYGVEAFAEAKVTRDLRLRADYTYTVAKDAVADTELLRRPRNKASVSAIWNPTGALTLSSTVLYVSGWRDYDRQGLLYEPGDAPGYTVVNLAANYVMNGNVTWFGRIDNLFDRHYDNPLGWEAPGIGIFGGVRLSN